MTCIRFRSTDLHVLRMDCKVKKVIWNKIQERNHYLSISKNQKSKIKNPTNCWTIHGYISLYCHSSSPFWDTVSRFAVFLRISFGSFVSLGWFYPWTWSAAQEVQKPLVLNPDPHVVSNLRPGGADQQALKRGVGYHAGSYPVPGRIHFGIGLSLSDEGIWLRTILWPKSTCVLASDRTGFLHVSKVPGQQAARSSRGVKRKSRKKSSGEVCSCRFKENRCSPPGRRSTAS